MRLLDTMGEAPDRLRRRREQTKMDSLDRDNERLRTELRTLRSDLESEREERSEMLDALRKAAKNGGNHRRGGVMRWIVIGGTAYVLGARAGRERYEQIMNWVSSFRGEKPAEVA